MRHMMFKILVLLALPLLIASCASNQPKVTTVELTFEISADANPDQLQRASPVVVAMHQLRNGNGYQQASLIKMFQNPSSVLGADLISTQKFGPYYPGTRVVEKFIVNDETQSLGFLAELSDFETARARMTSGLTQYANTKLTVRVDRAGIWVYARDQ